MSSDSDLIQFSSNLTIDKIQSWSTTDDSSTNLDQFNLTVEIPAAPTVLDDLIGIGSITNPYGSRGLTTLAWSLDGINWYPQNAIIFYYNTVSAGYYWKMFVTMACSDDDITFMFDTQYTDGSQTVYLQFAVDNPI